MSLRRSGFVILTATVLASVAFPASSWAIGSGNLGSGAGGSSNLGSNLGSGSGLGSNLGSNLGSVLGSHSGSDSGVMDEFTPPAPKLDFEALSAQLKLRLDTAFARITKAITILDPLPINQETKEVIQEGLKKTADVLMIYKEQLASAQTLDDVQAVNTAAIAYLSAHTNDIKTAMQTSKEVLEQNFLVRMQTFEGKVDIYLQALKLSCPKAIKEIKALEKELDSLDALLLTLATDVEAHNVTAAQTDIQTIIPLAQNIVTHLKAIQSMCFADSAS